MRVSQFSYQIEEFYKVRLSKSPCNALIKDMFGSTSYNSNILVLKVTFKKLLFQSSLLRENGVWLNQYLHLLLNSKSI